MKTVLIYLNNDKMVHRGVGFIATQIVNAGHALTFYDTAYHDLDKVVASIESIRPDILLISASTLFYGKAKLLANMVKQRLDIPILLGGLHATIVRDEVLQECSNIDYICIGEGEDFIVEFLDKLSDNSNINDVANLGYRRDDGEITVNPVRPCTNLTSLPKFQYDFFEQSSIVRSAPKDGFTYVYATRGCPYNCTYCCNGCYLKLYQKEYLRKHDIDYVIAELQHLKKDYGAKFFYFGDEMILFDKQYITELFHRVKKEVDIPFGCMLRVEKITPDVIELFRETGCCYISMGVECGDEQFRHEFLNRHMSNQMFIDAFKMLRSIKNMFIYAFYMKGYPVANDAELFKKTMALNKILKPDLVQITTFYPFRGTKLYDYCLERDMIDFEKVKTQENYIHDSILKTASNIF